MIKAIEKEYEVTCESCGKPATRREASVAFPGKGGCQASYDTHSRCLTEEGHLAAITRMNAFFEKAYDFEQALNRMPQEDRLLTFGTITRFEVNTLCPDACSPRMSIQVEAEIKAATMSQTVVGEILPLEGLDVKAAYASVRLLADAAANQLKYRFNQGLF